MADSYEELFSKLKKHYENSDNMAEAESVNQMLEEVRALVEEHIKQRDSQIYREVQSIGSKIDQTKQEMKKSISETAVSDAKTELNAVVKSTEEATDVILDTAEHIQSLIGGIENKDIAQALQKDASTIFEACNFQDLTGQRIAKVTSTLKFIEDVVGNLLSVLAKDIGSEFQEDESESLKSGPQLSDDTPSQDDVDKLFDQA